MRVTAAATAVDSSHGSQLDLNGDGYEDVAIGSPSADSNRGRVDVYLGSASGLGTTPTITLRGRAEGDKFGFAVSNVGDINGDGFADIGVGAIAESPGGRAEAGSVSVYYGSVEGLSITRSTVVGGNFAEDHFGVAVATAGDFNGDGFADLIVGAELSDQRGLTDSGAAYVFFGGAGGLQTTMPLTIAGSMARENAGRAVAGGCDINGDNLGDVIIGQPGVDRGAGVGSGGFIIVLGNRVAAALPHASISGARAGDALGTTVACGGDINGDGWSDVVATSPNASTGAMSFNGSATVYFGSSQGLQTTAAFTVLGSSDGDHFGNAVASPRDVDGDGLADFAVGVAQASPSATNEAGSVVFFRGARSSMAPPAAFSFDGAELNGAAGHAVAFSDVDGDNLAELIVGAINNDREARLDTGTVSVLRGTARGFDSSPSLVLSGNASNQNFGWAISQ